jgi:transcriptional regulator with PAS, ATPase and Fis domain
MGKVADKDKIVIAGINLDTETITESVNNSFIKMLNAMKAMDLYDLIQIDIGLPEVFANHLNHSDIVKVLESKKIDFKKKPFRFSKRLLFFAESDDPLLIVGETGTSKQLIAESIHKAGFRSHKPFNEINCSAFPETLFDAMLFGSKKGSHSEARTDQKGLLEETNGGVLFLDEIGKIPLSLQAKLLKVVESKIFYRLGDYGKPNKTDIRFIAAVHPGDLVNGNLLPDLKYRFGFPCCIELPTLFERIKAGGPQIIQLCFDNVLKKMDLHMDITLNEDCFDLFKYHSFEGNYRELEAILKSAIIDVYIDEREKIMPTDLRIGPSDVSRKDDKYIENLRETAINSTKLSEIIEFSEKEAIKIKKEIIRTKIESIYKAQKEIRPVLTGEGMSDAAAGNYSMKLKKIVGSLKEIKKNV